MGHSHPVTDDWLSQVFGTQVRIASETRIGDGLVGMNLRLELLHTDSDRVPDSIIAKLPSPDPTSRATGIALRNYEREVKFYRDVASTVQINAPRCFHSELDEQSGDFVLLLEDLAPAAQGDQVAGCSIHHARVAVLELAKLHGPRWDDSSLADIEWLQRHGADDAGRFNMLWSMFLPGFLVTYAPYLSPQAIGLIERFGGKIGTWLDFETPMKTVTHGDYRLDNLMFASDAGGHPITAVDWQTPGHGPAAGDLSYFLGAGPSSEDRRQIERSLLDEYRDALLQYDVVVDGEELWNQYRWASYGGVIMSVIASQLVGGNERSEAMFAAMAVRHTQHVLDLDAESMV